MPSWSGFFNTIILLGAVQGFIVSGLLCFSASKSYSNRLLAALILLISLACFNLYGNYSNWFNSSILRFLADLIPLVIVMPFGPLIYFYVQSVLDPGFRISKRQRRHFYPVVVDLVPSLTIVVFMVGYFLNFYKNASPWGIFIDQYNVYADIPRWLSVTFYIWLSAKKLKAHRQMNKGELNGHTIHFRWLVQFIRVFSVFQVIWLAYLIPYVIPRYTDKMLDIFDWYPIYIPMAMLIYWLGIKGYSASQQQVILQKKVSANLTVLSPGLIKDVIAALTKLMEEEKAYLNPALNLALVAGQTGYPQKTISTVLNQHLRRSFNEFINSYRVAEFKEKICMPGLSNLTIAGIALECGFNSQATFQRTFKEITGQSPSEYRKATSYPVNH